MPLPSAELWRTFDAILLVLIGNAGVVLSVPILLYVIRTCRPEAVGHYLRPSIVAFVVATPIAASWIFSIPGPELPTSERARFVIYFAAIFPIPMTLILIGKFFASEYAAHDHSFDWEIPAALAAVFTLLAKAMFSAYITTPAADMPQLVTWSLALCGVAFAGGWLVDHHPTLSFSQAEPSDAELAAPTSKKSTDAAAIFGASTPLLQPDEHVPSTQARTVASPVAQGEPLTPLSEPPAAAALEDTTENTFDDSSSPAVPIELEASTENLELSIPENPGAIAALPATISAGDGAPPPVPEIPSASSVETIQLKLKRSQRSSVLGAVIFTVDARVSLPRADLELVRKYRLGSIIVYDSKARTASSEALTEHLKGVRDEGFAGLRSDKPVNSIGKSLYRLARASASATMMALALRITIESLIKGVHIECKSLGELIEAENAICESAEFIKKYLSLASTFDGREEIVEI
ncbi:hypothetical protein [Rhodoplanes elegans]|uniref:hypothetical protein n=1 Tax=Rhodoplanes elegans TaxID=29408 RepID=UPI0011B93A61|nr:hypothetical protein [Rhodoplanes elegans]